MNGDPHKLFQILQSSVAPKKQLQANLPAFFILVSILTTVNATGETLVLKGEL